MSKISNAEAIAVWSAMPNEAMDAYDDQGDFAKRHLLNNHLFRLLGSVDGQRVMDAGCGQGYLGRLLADRGAVVVAVEPADALIGRAREIEREHPRGISFTQADLANMPDLGGPVDAVVCNMVLLSIPDWKAALASCVESLRPGGRLVFSVHHPAFEELLPTWSSLGHYRTEQYFDEYELHGPHATDFHRPLSAYINEVIALGCRIAEVCEPRLDAVVAHESTIQGIEAYTRLPNFVIVAAVKD